MALPARYAGGGSRGSGDSHRGATDIANAAAPTAEIGVCAHPMEIYGRVHRVRHERSRRNPRPWVVSHRNGWGCLQTESELALNMRAAERQKARLTGKPMTFYVSIEDSSALASMASLRRFNLSTLMVAPLLDEASCRCRPPSRPSSDQLACAHATTLLLNAFSTFSQLVMGALGAPSVGPSHHELSWVRDLTKRQQVRLGVSVVLAARRFSEEGAWCDLAHLVRGQKRDTSGRARARAGLPRCTCLGAYPAFLVYRNFVTRS